MHKVLQPIGRRVVQPFNTILKLSDIRAQHRIVRDRAGQYWQDKLTTDLFRRNPLREGVQVAGQILALLTHQPSGEILKIRGLNIVTNDGDVYYAQSAVAETPTDDFDAAAAGFRLGTSATAPTKTDTDVTTENSAGRKATDATYPQTDDQDADNTGAGTDIVTWRVSYTVSEANITGIQEGAIVDERTTPTAALTHFLMTSFTKTSSDTLKIFVNHTMNGV